MELLDFVIFHCHVLVEFLFLSMYFFIISLLQICVWCWHHIMDMAEKDDTEGRCPACRSPYDKEKIVGMAAKCERLFSCPVIHFCIVKRSLDIIVVILQL